MSRKKQTGSSMIQGGEQTLMTTPPLASAGSSPHVPTVPLQAPTQEQLSGLDNTIWLGSPLTCDGRDEYEAFKINGITIRNNSFVYIHGERGKSHLAYIKNMYEQNGEKLMRILWFWKQEELTYKKILKQAKIIPTKEIFIERATDVVSVCCVDCTAMVLTLRDWKILSVTNSEVESHACICCRELKGNKLSNYDISELKGYYLQEVFKHLDDK